MRGDQRASSAPGEAVVRVLVQERGRLLGFLRSRVPDQDVAHDLLQTATLRALQRANGILDEDRIEAWLYRILRNVLTDHYRTQAASGRAFATLANLDPGETPPPEVEAEICACVSDQMSESELLAHAASLESRSEHPIARGIVDAARERGIELLPTTEFVSIPGRGARGHVDGVEVKVMSPGYLADHDIPIADPRVRRAAEASKTVVHVLMDDRPVGALALADRIRPESRPAVEALRSLGMQVMMLTGDAEGVARWVASELGLDDYFAEVLPEQKADKIREIRGRGLTVAMVGDGVNDAPALVEADIGIAIGAGTDVAVESADIVLVRSDPGDVLSVVELGRRTYRKMVQNLWWATGYNVVAIPLAAGALAWAGIVLSPAAGAVLMSLSTVIVAVNARLLGREGVTA